MTLVEFLAPLKDATHQERVLALLYFAERYEQKVALTVEEIRRGLHRARIPRAARINVADVLAKGGAHIDTTGARGRQKLWSLTETGRGFVRGKLGLPEADVEVEHDVSTLEDVVHKVSDL